MVGRWYISQCLDALIYLSHTIADPLFIISLVWDIETVRLLLVPLVWIKRSLHSHSFRVLQSFSTVPWLLSSSEVCSRYYSKCAGRALTVHYTIPSSSSLPGLRIIAVDRSRQLDWPNNNNTLRSSRTPGTRFTTFSPNPGRRQASKQAVGAQYEINLENKSVECPAKRFRWLIQEMTQKFNLKVKITQHVEKGRRCTQSPRQSVARVHRGQCFLYTDTEFKPRRETQAQIFAHCRRCW